LVPMITAGHACFDRLTVRDARTGRPPGSCSRADLVAEGAQSLLPGPTIAPRQECPGGRLPLGQLLWKHPPPTAAAHHAEHGVADRSAAHHPRGQLAYSVREIGATASLPWSGAKQSINREPSRRISGQQAVVAVEVAPAIIPSNSGLASSFISNGVFRHTAQRARPRPMTDDSHWDRV
jgi:hypothetical protein